MNISTKLTPTSPIAAVVAVGVVVATLFLERKIRERRKAASEKKSDSERSVKERPKEEPVLVKENDGVQPKTEPFEEQPVESKAPGNKKLLVLISSYSPNIAQKTSQERAMTIIKGLKVRPDQMETIDGANKDNRERRNELFGVSGIRAKYPQFFVVDANDQTKFVADWDGFEMLNEMGTLKETLNLA